MYDYVVTIIFKIIDLNTNFVNTTEKFFYFWLLLKNILFKNLLLKNNLVSVYSYYIGFSPENV